MLKSWSMLPPDMETGELENEVLLLVITGLLTYDRLVIRE
jgi:hypothetical protein